ncbi:ERF family protein [Bacillus licheniformis]
MMNIYQKLVEVRKVVPYLKKSNQGHQYNYTGSSQVVGAIREKIDELGLLLIPAIVDKK